MTGAETDWRTLDGAAIAWFDAPSLIEGAALAARVMEFSPGSDVDLRRTGVQVRLDSVDHAEAISTAARDLGLVAHPAKLQQLSVVCESPDPPELLTFWQRVFDYVPAPDGALADPLRRDPALRIRPTTEVRALRNRLHLDVVRTAEAVGQAGQAGLGEGSGPYGVCHADPDGNEVDLVPGGMLGEGSGTADWRAVFSALACYRTTSPGQQDTLATAAAALAEAAGFPLLIDLRPGLVILDSGKDQWEDNPDGVDFTGLASTLQSTARQLGATADPELSRFAQLFLDAADLPAVRAFWITALGYVADPRDRVSDIVDPLRLNPVLVFQELDATDTDRRRQRNRIHLELAVPSDVARMRLAACLAAGGRLLEQSAGRCRVADPEDNELVIIDGS